jgi:hypothetical protein
MSVGSRLLQSAEDKSLTRSDFGSEIAGISRGMFGLGTGASITLLMSVEMIC